MGPAPQHRWRPHAHVPHVHAPHRHRPHSHTKPKKQKNKMCTGYVLLFQHGSFNGWKAKFTNGFYNHKKMAAKGAKNDDASSIKVGMGCTATLYQHSNKAGWKAKFPYRAGGYKYKKFIAQGAKNDATS